MAKAILNARVYLAQLDLSGVANAAALNLKTDLVDCTTFEDTARDKLAGMTDVIAEVSGYFDAGEALTGNPDHKLFDQVGLSDVPLSLCTESGAFNKVVYFFKPILTQYTPLEGKVSEMAAFKLHGEGTGTLVRGRILTAKSEKINTGAGTKVNLGAYTATQFLYGALHIFSASAGDTLDCVIAIADRINTVTINAAGTGYSQNNKLTVVQAGGSLGVVNVDTVGGGGEVTAISVFAPGSGYAVANALSTTGGGGAGCKVNITAITDTTVITFPQKTAVGSDWQTDAGPITDVNFKAKWTIGGVSPAFTFAIVAGVSQ